MSNAVDIAEMLKPRQRQALEILAKAERPLRNKDFHERFETDGRRTTGWSKALGPTTKPRNHDPESLRARGLVKVTDNRYYEMTPLGCEVAGAIESVTTHPTVRRKLPCADGAPAIGSSGNLKEPSKLTPQAERPSEQLREFRSELDKLLPSPNSRPFLCQGSPLKCDIFIVGTNSAREIEKPFWSFWFDSSGFNKVAYLRELEQLRRGLTKTRKNIEIVARAAGHEVTLDTNIYLQPTPTEAELQDEDRNADVIEYLLKKIRPKVVLSHGAQAKMFFAERCSDFVDDGVTAKEVAWNACQWQFRLLCSSHLGFRTLTNEAAAEEAERIGQALADALHKPL